MRRRIDQYFKKGLNVPQEPPVGSWEFIQQNITKKEKKRVFPFWIKISGIAALFLMMIGGGYMVERELDSPNTQQPIVNSSSDKYEDLENNSDVFNPTKNEASVLSSSSHFQTESPSDLGLNKTGKSYVGIVLPAAENSNKIQSSENSLELLMNGNSIEHQQSEIEKNILKTQPQIAWIMPSWNESSIESEKKEMSENEEIKTSLVVHNSTKKSKSFKKKNTDFDRFYIAGFASPMAFNTFVGSSMLADEMSQYDTENSITLAYGVKAGYAVSPTVKLRTGISMIGFEQITKDVPLASNIQSRELPAVDQINNVNYNGNLRIDNSLSASFSDEELNNKVGNGNIQQQSSYIEIPVEAEVALFKTNSIGISATAGGSTWLLSKNKIYVHTEEYTEELGKASNLNNVSFSANAGLKFDLNLSESVQLNLEPNFKYLVNPVNDIKNYNPYTVGVNAGVSVSLK